MFLINSCTSAFEHSSFCQYFNLSHSDFIKQRDTVAWAPACIPLQSPSSWSLNTLNSILTIPFSSTGLPPLLLSNYTSAQQPVPLPDWNHIPSSHDIVTISTGFRPDLPANLKLRFHKDKSETSKKERWAYTEEQRAQASKAVVPKNFEEFKKKVISLTLYFNQLKIVQQLITLLSLGKRYNLKRWIRLDPGLLEQ